MTTSYLLVLKVLSFNKICCQRPLKLFLIILEGEGMREIQQEIPAVVYNWGGGILKPTVLPLPKNDIEIIQVAIGRTIKAGVTSKGRLIVWEV